MLSDLFLVALLIFVGFIILWIVSFLLMVPVAIFEAIFEKIESTYRRTLDFPADTNLDSPTDTKSRAYRFGRWLRDRLKA